MKRTLLLILLLVGCRSLDSSSIASLSEEVSSQVASSSLADSSSLASSLASADENGWDEQIGERMDSILGVRIPYLEQFGDNYRYATGYISQSTIPYINPYIENGSDWCLAYGQALVANGYIFDFAEPDENQVTQHYYYLPFGQGEVIVFFSFYYSEGSNWFDIYAYFDGERGDQVPIPDSFDATFIGADFPKDYQSNATLTSQGVTLTHTDVMLQNGMIQIKNNSGVITGAGVAFKYLYLEGLDYIDRIEVLKGPTLNSLTSVESFNLVYDLSGANYFRIKSKGLGVARIEMIGIVLA